VVYLKVLGEMPQQHLKAVVLGFGLLTFAVGLWHGQPAVQTFLAAVALVVAVIPEGLPAALTITLAIGILFIGGALFLSGPAGLRSRKD